MKVQEYIKKRLNSIVDIEVVKKSQTLVGITEDAVLTEDLEERIDAIWSELNLSGASEIKQIFSLLKEFGLELKKSTDEDFLGKLEIIRVFLEVHGYKDIEEIAAKEESKIKQVYDTLGIELKYITLIDLENVSRFNLAVINKLGLYTLEELGIVCEFWKGLGIDLKLSKENFFIVGELSELIEDLGYQADLKDWLSEKEVNKLKVVFREFGVEKIEKWNKGTSNSISIIAKEFGINLPEVSNLKLKSKLGNIKKLKIFASGTVEDIKGKIAVIKYIKNDIEKLTKLDIERLEKLLDILKLGKDREQLLKWIEGQGVDLSIKNLDEENLAKVKQIVEKVEVVTGSKLSSLTISQIEFVERLVWEFTSQSIMEVDKGKLSGLSHIVKERPNRVDSSNLAEVFGIFKIDPFASDKSIYKDAKELLDSFDSSLFRLSESEANRLLSTMTSLGLKAGEKYSKDEKLKKAVSDIIEAFSYGSLLEINDVEVEKLMLLATSIGVSEINKIKAEDVMKLKTIVDALNIDFKEVYYQDLEGLVKLLMSVGFKDAEGKQGWISYLTEGKEAAFKAKITDIKKKAEVLGYSSIFSLNEEEYEGINKLLKEYDESVDSISVDKLTRLSDCYGEFGLNISREPLYKLIEFSKFLKVLDIMPFGISEVEIKNLKSIEGRFNKSIIDFTEQEIEKLKEYFIQYELEIKKDEFEEGLEKLVINYKSVGFTNILRIGEESKICLDELLQLSSKVKNMDKLSALEGIVSKIQVNIEELEIEECKNLESFLKPFKFDEGDKEEVKYKFELISAVKNKCKLDFSEFKEIKTEGALENYNKYQACEKNSEQEHCKSISEGDVDIEKISAELCSNYDFKPNNDEL